ncbi:MAG: GGDEF domain-containing protein [Butyrivibrio sp.]|nr:GGDEF domain-containing protein [Butyrivibrio sp.]
MISDHDLLRALLSTKSIKYFWKDTSRRFVGASQSFLDYYGFESLDYIIGRTDEDMGWHVDPAPFQNDELIVINEGKSIYKKPGLCIIKGQMRHIEATKLPVFDDYGTVIGLVGFFEDVTSKYEEHKRNQNVSETDELTGLPNRVAFYTTINEYVKSYEESGTDFAVFYIDIDDLKITNEKYGHEFGDQVLKNFADKIVSIAKQNSVAFSFGGDEFVIVHQLPDTGKGPASVSRSVLNMEERIRMLLCDIQYIDGKSYRAGVSVGFSVFSESHTVEKLLYNATRSMREDKHERLS